ncbi:YlbF family regulator [Alkaliphilus serpentinus]|uniref:UPF0342 protein F8153_11560 n=1 Tax=Alkaliphilus serpentinus TaxID=1482731 RepID=A0A833HMH0_9FIRM|nr:YlbF family regulator [Alkaliphilus serpentinus]KAB3527613.1 YlbF family regulator [Alkaliphilus serpentinus]
MNVYDCAHQLAKALKGSDEYKAYKELEKNLNGNPQVKDIMEDFRRRQFEIQSAQMMGQEVEEEKIQKLQELHNLLIKDDIISRFMQAEFRLTQMMADIYKILGEAMDINIGLDQ